jgi:Tyrosine phosphatase family
VPRNKCAADYAETDQHVAHLYPAQLAAQPDPEKRAWLAGFQISRPDDLLMTLAHLDVQWGGINAYLKAYGVAKAEQRKLAARLLKTDS